MRTAVVVCLALGFISSSAEASRLYAHSVMGPGENGHAAAVGLGMFHSAELEDRTQLILDGTFTFGLYDDVVVRGGIQTNLVGRASLGATFRIFGDEHLSLGFTGETLLAGTAFSLTGLGVALGVAVSAGTSDIQVTGRIDMPMFLVGLDFLAIEGSGFVSTARFGVSVELPVWESLGFYVSAERWMLTGIARAEIKDVWAGSAGLTF